MKHSPELFDARSLQNDTRLLFKLKLILGTVCAYGGEVPLSVKQLSERLSTSTHRTKLLLKKLEEESVVYWTISGKLFFNKYVVRSESDTKDKDKLYTRCYNFFTCDEFLKEDRMVQRFVLHFVGKELVYLPGNFYHTKINKLYGENGLFGIRTKPEMMRVIEKASKYLKLTVSANGEACNITGVLQNWLDMGETHSEGASLWVRKQLNDHEFVNEFITERAVWQLAKVMEHYTNQYGYDYASQVFNQALFGLHKSTFSSLRFRTLLYKEYSSISSNEADSAQDTVESGELNELSAYFKGVMENAELQFAEQLSFEIDQLHEKVRMAEQLTFDDESANEKNRESSIAAHDEIQRKVKKIMDVQRVYLKKFNDSPDKLWFFERWSKIARIHPFIELNRAMQNYQQGNRHDNRLPSFSKT